MSKFVLSMKCPRGKGCSGNRARWYCSIHSSVLYIDDKGYISCNKECRNYITKWFFSCETHTNNHVSINKDSLKSITTDMHEDNPECAKKISRLKIDDVQCITKAHATPIRADDFVLNNNQESRANHAPDSIRGSTSYRTSNNNHAPNSNYGSTSYHTYNSNRGYDTPRDYQESSKSESEPIIDMSW